MRRLEPPDASILAFGVNLSLPFFAPGPLWWSFCSIWNGFKVVAELAGKTLARPGKQAYFSLVPPSCRGASESQQHTVKSVQFAHMAAHEPEVGLHLEAGIAGAACELMESGGCSCVQIGVPELFQMNVLSHVLLRRQ